MAAAAVKKTALIIDGHYALDDNDVFGAVNYSTLLTVLKGLKCNVLDKVFLAPPSKSFLPTPPDTLTQLKSLGFKIEELPSNRKKTVCPHCSQNSALETLRDLDVAISTHLMVQAFSGGVDRIVLFAGDGDFIQAINSIRSFSNVQIVGVGNRDSLSFKLEEVCDVVIWLDTVNDLIREDWETKGSKVVIQANPNAQQRKPAAAPALPPLSSSSSSSAPSTSAAAARKPPPKRTAEEEAVLARMLEMELAAEEQRVAQAQAQAQAAKSKKK